MSEYFRVLNRIEREQRTPGAPEAGPVPDERESTPRQSVVLASPPLPPASPVTTPRLSPAAAKAFRRLFDNIRVLANGSPTRALVFVGASGKEPVRTVIDGLAAHMEQLGLDVLPAELADARGRPILRRRPKESVLRSGAGDAMPVDLGAPAAQVEVTEWLEGATRAADVVIIEGRPLTESVDAALLARVCDGLVVVAQTEVTHRDTLRATAERARAVGCRTLGLVMYGTKNRIPAWIRRLTGIAQQEILINGSSS